MVLLYLLRFGCGCSASFECHGKSEISRHVSKFVFLGGICALLELTPTIYLMMIKGIQKSGVNNDFSTFITKTGRMVTITFKIFVFYMKL